MNQRVMPVSRRIVLLLAVTLVGTMIPIYAADVNGTWDLVTTSPEGEEVRARLDLKTEGASVSGTVAPEFEGEVTILEGTLQEERLTLKVKVKNDDGEPVYTLSGVVQGDEITGLVTAQAGERQIRMNWKAKKRAA